MFLKEENKRIEKFYREQMSFLNEEEKESSEVIKDVDGDQPSTEYANSPRGEEEKKVERPRRNSW